MLNALKEILNDEKKIKEIAKAAFDSADTDRSGEIEESELQQVMARIAIDIGSAPPSMEDVRSVMEHLDIDNSGKIDFEEFYVLIKDVLILLMEEYSK